MHKNFKLSLLISILTITIVFHSGCIDSRNEVDPAIQKIKDTGKIVVGTSTPYEPMEYINEDGDIVGFDIDLARAIALDIGVELELIDMDFDSLITSVVSGEIDIAIAAITINLERSEKVLFSNPYFNAGQIIIVNVNNTNISKPEDIQNKKVGVQNGTTSQIEAEKYTNSSLVFTYPDYSIAVDELLNGFIEVIIIDYPAGSSLVKNNKNIKIVGNPFTTEWYGIAIKKENNALKDKIDRIINSGIINVLEERWF